MRSSASHSSCRSFRDRFEHRLDIGRRAGDDTEDLAGRGLLFQGFCQLARAVFDLVLQVGVGFLKLGSHLVEFVGEHFDLVTGLEIETIAEIAGADALDAFARMRTGRTTRRARK